MPEGGRRPPDPGGGGRAQQWSQSSEAFVLFQLKQTANFWRMKKPASFNLEVRPDGGAELRMNFQLGSPSEFLPSPYTPIPSQYPNPASQVSGRAGSHPNPQSQSHPTETVYRCPSVPLFPNGELRATRPHHSPSQSSTQRRPGYSHRQRRSYVRAVKYSAMSAQTDPEKFTPGSLRELAQKAIQAATVFNSTPQQGNKRKRSNSSLLSFREEICLPETFTVNESGTPETLRDADVEVTGDVDIDGEKTEMLQQEEDCEDIT